MANIQSIITNGNGNVLIGTTTDNGNKLRVNGNAEINNVTIGTDITYGNPYRVVAFGYNGDGNNRIFAANDAADGMYFAAATGRGFVWRPNGGTTQRMGLDSSGVFSTLGPTLGSTAGNQAYNAIFELSNGNSSLLEIKDVRTANGSDWTFAGKRLQMRIDSTYMGYIQFNGDSNNAGISFGTGATTTAPGNVNEIMRITTSGNVLIGTTSDSGGKLRVQGTAWISGNVFTNGEQGIELAWTGNAINDNRVGRIRPISTSSQNPYAGGLAFDYYKYDGAAYNFFEGMRLNGSGILSVGTSNPYSGMSTKLYVGYPQDSTVNNADQFISVGAGGGSTNKAGINFLIYSAGYGGRIYTDDAVVRGLAFDVLQAGTFYNAMNITRTTSPNVLIGTTTDSGYKLAVNGTITTANYSYLSTYGYGATQLRTYEISTGTSVSDNQVFDLYLGRFGNGYHRITLWGTGYGTDSGNYFDITRTWNGTPRIITNGGLIMGGAQYTIHWAAVSYGQYDLFIKWYAGMPTGQSNIINYAIQSNTGYQYVQFDYPGGVTVPTLDSSNLVASRMTIQYTSGNVGIGTTNPSTTLDVLGKIKLGLDGTYGGSDYVTIGFGGTSNGYNRVFGYNGTSDGLFLASATGQGIAFRTNGGSTDNMFIAASGNVGIGTTSPNRNLTVSGNGTLLGIQSDTVGGYSEIEMTANGVGSGYIFKASAGFSSYAGAGSLNIYNSGSIGFHTASVTNAMFITSATGNVGIGTTSPGAKLEVVAGNTTSISVRSGNSGQYSILSVGRTSSDIIMASAASSGQFWTGSVAGDGWVGSTNGTLSLGNDTTGVANLTIKSGNVGIGTTSPTGKLHIAQSNSGGVAAILLSEDESTIQGPAGNTQIRMGSNLVLGASNIMTFGTNGSECMRITAAGNVYINSTSMDGKFGINTASSTAYNPNAYNGNSANIRLTNGSAGVDRYTGIAFGGGGATEAFIGSVQNASELAEIVFQTFNGSAYGERMRITSAGSVGIGTSAPTTLLQVASSQTNSSIRTGGLEMQSYAVNNSWYAENVYFDGSSWRLRSNGYATQMYMQGGTIDFNRVATGSAGDAATLLTTIRLNNTGNVLIGTTADAGYKLRVNGTSYFDGLAHFGQSATSGSAFRWGAFGTAVSSDTMLCMNQLWNGGGWTILEPSYGTTYVNLGGAVASPTIQFGTGPANTEATTKMIILNNGNVLIGTATDNGYKLRVNGKGYFDNNVVITPTSESWAEGLSFVMPTTSTWGGLRWRRERVGNDGNWYIGYTALDSTDDLVFGANNGGTQVDNIIRLTKAGNVGIGTTSPSVKLHVAGSTFVDSGFLYMSSGLPIVWGSAESIEGSTGVINIKTASVSRIYINSTGNVGIGTTAPSTLLNVMTATNAVDVLRIDNSGGNSGSVQGVTHLAINHFGTGTNPSTRITAYQDGVSGWPGGMYFSTRSLNTDSAPVERMRITSDGNVGIGTTSPQYPLVVNGDAQINASGTGPAYAYVPDGGFGVDSLVTSGTENVALGKPDVWLRIHVDGVAFVFPGYQEP